MKHWRNKIFLKFALLDLAHQKIEEVEGPLLHCLSASPEIATDQSTSEDKRTIIIKPEPEPAEDGDDSAFDPLSPAVDMQIDIAGSVGMETLYFL